MNATNAISIDPVYTTIKLIGGNNSGIFSTNPDLLVLGGSEIKKDLVVLGNISGNVLGDRLGNLVGNVNAWFIWTDDIEVEQELKVDFIAPLLTNEICVNGDFKVTGNLTVGTSTVTLNGIGNEIEITSGASLEKSVMNNQRNQWLFRFNENIVNTL